MSTITETSANLTAAIEHTAYQQQAMDDRVKAQCSYDEISAAARRLRDAQEAEQAAREAHEAVIAAADAEPVLTPARGLKPGDLVRAVAGGRFTITTRREIRNHRDQVTALVFGFAETPREWRSKPTNDVYAWPAGEAAEVPEPRVFTEDEIAAAIEADPLARGYAATGAPGLARDRALRVLHASA